MENNTINCSPGLFFKTEVLIVETEKENYEFNNITEAVATTNDEAYNRRTTTFDATFHGMTSHLFYLATSDLEIKRLRLKGTASDYSGMYKCEVVFEGPFTVDFSTITLDPLASDCRITFTRLMTGKDTQSAFYDIVLSDDIEKQTVSIHHHSLVAYKAYLDAQKQRRIPA